MAANNNNLPTVRNMRMPEIYAIAPKPPSFGTLLVLTFLPLCLMNEQRVLPEPVDTLMTVVEFNGTVSRLENIFQKYRFPQWIFHLNTFILAAAIFILFLVIVMVQFHITQQSQGTTVILIVVALVAAFAISVPTFMMYYMKSNLKNEIEDALSAINLETVSRGYRW
jgi:hypothetical protein